MEICGTYTQKRWKKKRIERVSERARERERERETFIQLVAIATSIYTL